MVFWIGNLALAGIPFFAGYYSKDAIMEAAFASGSAVGMYGFVMTMIAAFLTAFYSWRLTILTFHGKPRADHHVMEHVHESPPVMLIPLVLLAIGAVFTGYAFFDLMVGHHWEEFWNGSIVNAETNHIMHAMHEVPEWVPLAPTVMGLSGIALAYIMYMFVPSLPGKLASAFHPIYLFLLNKWYFDELYDFLFVRPCQRLARTLWKVGDAQIIDGMPNGAASLTVEASRGAVKLQTGKLANYAFAMIIGLALFVSIFLLGVMR